jgi:small subunit ribosomal protein S2
MPLVTVRQLLDAGVHFGHQTRRWNPKMRRFILGERNGIYLIDLHKTLVGIEAGYAYVRELVANGGIILFVGTKKQTQGPIADYAQACNMPFVNQRWLGGMLTNFQTVSGRVKRMQELVSMQKAGDFEGMPKREALRHSRELDKLQRNLGGISNLDRLPDAIFVIDTKKEHIAVTEANKLGLPVVAVVDTNCDPDCIDFVIPGNDDAIRAGALLCRVIADAVVEGRWIRANRPPPPAPAQRNGAKDKAPDAAQAEPAAPSEEAAPDAEPSSEPAAAAASAPAADDAAPTPSPAPAATASGPAAPSEATAPAAEPSSKPAAADASPPAADDAAPMPEPAPAVASPEPEVVVAASEASA